MKFFFHKPTWIQLEHFRSEISFKNMPRALIQVFRRKITNMEVESTIGLSRWLSGKVSACQCRRRRFDPWVGKNPWRRKWVPTSVCLPGESHGQKSLVGYSACGHRESDMIERLHFFYFFSKAGKNYL